MIQLQVTAADAPFASSPNSTVAAEKDVQDRIGPTSEKRFPPLQVPDGFKAILFACDPLIEYPSVIAIGPRAGQLFVAHDYVTGLGVEIVRRDEIRLIQDTDGDGYADRSSRFADGFNSIQGLAYQRGTVYAMHAPLLTALQDTDGDGVADQRRDLLSGLGLPPEENSNRLHCANGVVVGHDGWLYLALGDRGCDVLRPEGDRLLFQQGGILRCRDDGRDLHVFAGGLRNIYDIALDDQLNVLVRDNENDGGDYMIRVYHSFHGADHGYPYLYDERPEEAIAPLADLGRGSSAGVATYLETAFPETYRGNLFCCEWGRAVVRYQPRRKRSGFATMSEIDFAAGAPHDPYGLKPTDLVVDWDGSLLVSDWADGQRPQRGRGRIYRIVYEGKQGQAKGPIDGDRGQRPAASQQRNPPSNENPVASEIDVHTLAVQLDSPSYFQRVAAQQAMQRLGRQHRATLMNMMRTANPNDRSRLWEREGEAPAEPPAQRELRPPTIALGHLGWRARLHMIWGLAHIEGANAIEDLFQLAENDNDPRVRAQAVRALADLTDPVLTQHRLDADRGSPRIARRLAQLAVDHDPIVMFEVTVALGRLRWPDSPNWLRQHLRRPDAALAHAAMQTLRRAGNWPAVLKLCDAPDDQQMEGPTIRTLALRAIAGRPDATVVDGLIERLRAESDASRRREYADSLARVYKKSGPWVYWGFRPAPRPANSETWPRTKAIQQALDRMLLDPDHDVRAFVLRRMGREKIPVSAPTLRKWLRVETDPQRVKAILNALKERPASETRSLLEETVQARCRTQSNRLTALEILVGGLDASTEARLLAVAEAIDDGPVLAEVLRHIGRRPALRSQGLLLRKLDSPHAQVRTAAIRSLAAGGKSAASPKVLSLLQDPDVGVRRAAAMAAGTLGVHAAVKQLLDGTGDPDTEIRAGSLASLTKLQYAGAVPQAIAALDHPATQPAALEYLAEYGGAEQIASVTHVAEASQSMEVLYAVVGALSRWHDKQPSESPHRRQIRRAVAEVQGRSGAPVRWQTAGPMSSHEAASAIEEATRSTGPDQRPVNLTHSRPRLATGVDALVHLEAAQEATTGDVWLAMSEVYVSAETKVEFLASSSGTLRIWLNSRSIFARHEGNAYRPNSDRSRATLSAGWNRLLVRIAHAGTRPRFHLRFRRTSSRAEHERLTQLALKGRGDEQRGRQIFFNAEKSQCVKCHRLGDQGERIGPDLTSIGRRFSRIHLIESILQPSHTVSPSYGTLAVVLTDGRVLAGVKVAETDTTLTVGDNQGTTHVVSKDEIDELQVRAESTMPDDLEKRLTDDEFLDLIAFLVAQIQATSRAQLDAVSEIFQR